MDITECLNCTLSGKIFFQTLWYAIDEPTNYCLSSPNKLSKFPILLRAICNVSSCEVLRNPPTTMMYRDNITCTPPVLISSEDEDNLFEKPLKDIPTYIILILFLLVLTLLRCRRMKEIFMIG